MKIKIGTRGSKLALWQAYHIEELLQAGGIQTELVIIETKGDKILNKPLSKIGSKGLFTEELEEKLLTGEIDIAVHSAKDMQSDLGPSLALIAFTKREQPNDVLVSFDKSIDLGDPTKKLLIGSSSTRRRAVLMKNYPHLTLVEARGNLQTRFQKMQEGQFHGMLLAYAGVHRMGYDEHIVTLFPLDEFTPAVGQGSIAIEASSILEAYKKEKIRALTNHLDTEVCLLAERAFLKKLQGGCSVPLFALATLTASSLSIHGGVISLNGKETIQTTVIGDKSDPLALGNELADVLLEKGAGEILTRIHEQKSLS